jgi:undecaprenyl-diphosphatase
VQSSEVGRFARRSAIGFVAVVLGAIALAAAVQTASGPVVQLDRAVAGDLNTVVAPHPWLVTTLQVLTTPGSAVTAWVVLTALTAVLLVRRRIRLALYVAVTGLGAATLSPLLKHLVNRLRPIVATPVATAGGPSFPSGHTLAVTVWVGVVLLVLLPVVPAHLRRVAVGGGVVLAVLVGLTRIALGVHFLSDVLGGWLIGTGWLMTTATAFRAWRRHEGLAVAPSVDGLEPEVARDLTPSDESPSHESHESRSRETLPRVTRNTSPHVWTTIAQLLVAAVLLLGVVVGIGLLLVGLGPGSALVRADVGVVAWLADHRTPLLDAASGPIAQMGNTLVVVAGGVVAAIVAYVATRRLRPPLVIATALVGEVLIFLASSAVVGRPRPPVAHLDATLPPTSSFPSGHTAAAVCLYGAIAALVLRGTRAWWRWVVLTVAVALVVVVAFARLYRGAHHPTDVLASIAFAVPWLLVTLRLVGDDPGERTERSAARRADRVGGTR